MAEVLAVTNRKAAHGKHHCGLCRRLIAAGEVYEDQRCADSGTVYTFRSHLMCVSAYRSWDPDDGETWDLGELSNGHLPPCPQAWSDGEEPCSCRPVTPPNETEETE